MLKVRSATFRDVISDRHAAPELWHIVDEPDERRLRHVTK